MNSEAINVRLKLDRYRVEEEIGRGGMAVVYRGIDTTLDREVAVKVLHPHLADKPDSRRRFEREARATAKLNHRNILEIYDFSGVDSDNAFIITEFIHGTTLRDFMTEHPLRHPEIAQMIMLEVSRAVSHAHSIGIIHRDIKPENIMIRSDGVLKLMDFGIAHILDLQQLTVTGALVGSPAHMAPEAVEGKPQDFRSDVFSLGTLLYFLATGKLPFFASNPHALMKMIVDGAVKNPQQIQPLIGRELHRIIKKALKKNPDERYQSVEEMIADLEQDLWAIDFTAPARELTSFFDDPERYQNSFATRLKSVLYESGDKLAKQRKIPQALDRFNRLLTLDETDERAQQALANLTEGHTRLWPALAIVAVLLVAIGGYLLWRWAGESKPAIQPNRLPAPVIAKSPLRRAAEPAWHRRTLPVREPNATNYVSRPRATGDPRHRIWSRQANVRVPKKLVGNNPKTPITGPDPKVPKPIVASINYIVRAMPPSSRILVNQKLRGTGLVRLSLKPGPHVFTIVPPLRTMLKTTFRVMIKASHNGKKPLLAARWRPASVVIRGKNVKAVRVRWPGSTLSVVAGRVVSIPLGIVRGMDAPQVPVQILVTMKTGAPRSFKSNLTAGQLFSRTF